MSIESKSTKLIQKLTRATVDDRVSWVKSVPPRYLVEGTEDIIALYMQCEYRSQKIGIFERRHKFFHDELEYSWSTKIGICIVDAGGTLLWQSDEGSSVLYNLFQLAQEQASDIDTILDDLLGD